MINEKQIKIISTGKYLPQKIVTDEFFDKMFNFEKGYTFHKSGVKNRHYIEDETQVDMAVYAAKDAFKKAGIDKSSIDCIVFCGGVSQQPIPCTASLIQKRLGLENSGIPCFDINSTCLSFVTALDVISSLIETNSYKRILLVASDIASVGIDYTDYKSCILFGDAAAAAIIEKTPKNESSKILKYNFKTYSEGTDAACIKGGGSLLHSTKYNEKNRKNYLFHMNGMKLYEIASKKLGQIFNDTLNECNLTMSDIKLIIPHQASLMSMKLLQRKMKVPNEKFMYNIEDNGNTIASSIPLALDCALEKGLVKRGDKIMFVGTSAGLSIGVMIFEY